MVALAVVLLEHIDVAFAARDVDALPRGIEKHVVRALHAGQRADMWPDAVSKTSKRAGERVATNNRWPLSSRAIGKLLSNAIRHREIAPVFRLITAICFRSGTFT